MHQCYAVQYTYVHTVCLSSNEYAIHFRKVLLSVNSPNVEN